MLTIQEVELLATILQRAGVTQIEALWVNGILDRLRAATLEQRAEAALRQEEKPDQQMEAQ